MGVALDWGAVRTADLDDLAVVTALVDQVFGPLRPSGATVTETAGATIKARSPAGRPGASRTGLVHKSVHNYKPKARLSFREPSLILVAGVGFEPTTSGL
jgi:hypothetical protein